MSTFDDPNREAVGLAPIWTGADAGPARPGPSSTKSFEPGDHTVAEVEEYLEANPDQRDAVLKAERKGKARATLIGG
jgi:hypothetical protein